jgi:hypothetical protein
MSKLLKHLNKGKAHWVSIYWQRKIFTWKFRLFKFNFGITIKKPVEYGTNSKRTKDIIKALKSREVGQLYGIRFLTTNDKTKSSSK